MISDCLITRVCSGSFVYKRWRLRSGDDVGSYGAVQQSRLDWQRQGVAGERRFQATPRQPGLNSHLNASEVALTAITADGRLLTHALPAKAEPPASPLASLDGAPFSVPPSCFLSPPYLFPSHLLAVFAPTFDLPFIAAISRKRRENFKHGRLSPRRPIANFVTVIIPTDGNTLDTFHYLYANKEIPVTMCTCFINYTVFFTPFITFISKQI